MAFPASNTERWFLHYNVGGNSHTMMARTGTAVTASDVSDGFGGFLGALSSLLALITIEGLEVSEENSDVRNPAEWLGAATYGSGTLPTAYDPVELTFPGRTSNGHKSRISVFGYKEPIPDDFRLSSAESAPITNAILVLGTTTGMFHGIDGLSPVWHPYANVGFNDHWTKNQRTGGA